MPASAIAVDTQAAPSSFAKAGKARKGFKVGFRVTFNGGEPVNVYKFKFKRLRMQCDQGKVLLNAKGFPDMPVTNDEFGGAFVDGDGQVDVYGKFNKKATKVEGSVEANGTFDNDGGGGDFTGCHGQKDYTAK